MAGTDLGTRIRRARERKRWSQQDLADAIGVAVRTVGSWERGEAVPRNALGALEDVLGMDLTGEQEPDPNMDKLRSMDLDTADLAEMLKKYQALQAAKREQGPARSTRAG
jgi:ribosome-binding protein aMBF1 (putative translation factor)